VSIKAIFWDNDGVLVETEQLYYAATREVLAAVGVDLTPAIFQELFLIQGRGAWHLAAEQGHPAHQLEDLRAARNRLYAHYLETTPSLVDGVTEVLGHLHGRYTMGCVTSSRRDHFEAIHRTTDLLKYFDFVLTSDEVSRVKPDPELYRLAIARSGYQPEECVAVEDSVRGLQAAVGAGLRCYVVPTELTRGCDFSKAAGVLTSVRELARLIEGDGSAKSRD
jgi:HAD superfamily hydrolase (TIGR01509 family)